MFICIILTIFITINKTICYYHTSDSIVNTYNTKKYEIRLHDCNDTLLNNIIIKNNSTTLPEPERKGYKFLGFSDYDEKKLYSLNVSNIDEINNSDLYAKWEVIDYEIQYDYNNDTNQIEKRNYNIEDVIEVPNPTRKGYSFVGWIGTDYDEPVKNLVISNSVGDKNYKAIWSKNEYRVNYYVNNQLWKQKLVKYNDPVENISGQEALDQYHKFNKWNNWQRFMPDHDLDLYANITNTYCQLTSGHGPYQNAVELLNLFQQIGFKGEILEADEAPGNYLVRTSYSLTKENIDSKKSYIESNTYYNSYNNYPYLYWLGISCNNGYSQVWTRNFGELTFR